MSRLATLKNKAPKEVLGLLSAVSNTLLPNPQAEIRIIESDITSRLVESILDEIHQELKIPKDDFSIQSRSKIYEFLSEEISKIALSDVSLNKIKVRLGNKGELHSNQYEVKFSELSVEILEALGERKSNIINAVINPDKFQHINPKYLPELRYRLTISIKYISHIRDKFTLIVITRRDGYVQKDPQAFRVYKSEVNFSDTDSPIEILKKFVDVYGLTYKFGEHNAKFIFNEVINIENSLLFKPAFQMKILEGKKGNFYYPLIIGGSSNLKNVKNQEVGEILLAFAVDIPKYVSTLKKYNVRTEENIQDFPEIGIHDGIG